MGFCEGTGSDEVFRSSADFFSDDTLRKCSSTSKVKQSNFNDFKLTTGFRSTLLKNLILRKTNISKKICDFRQGFFFAQVQMTNPRRWKSILTFLFRWSLRKLHWRPVEHSNQEKVGFSCLNTIWGSTGRHENNFSGNPKMCSFPTPN